MGRLSYEGQVSVTIDDRALAHLQLVFANKLRRGEPFTFSWRDDASVGHGRTMVWVHPQAALIFKFHGGRSPHINKTWLEALMMCANSPSGLYLVPEPPEDGVTAGEELP
jgi:hypothetical protein